MMPFTPETTVATAFITVGKEVNLNDTTPYAADFKKRDYNTVADLTSNDKWRALKEADTKIPEKFLSALREQVEGGCSACHREWVRGPNDTQRLFAMKKYWHVDCFRCLTCNKRLSDEYEVKDNDYQFCDKNCAVEKFCQSCQEFIGDEPEASLRKERGGVWHQKHFTCGTCDREVAPQEDFIFHKMKILCEIPCAEKKRGGPSKKNKLKRETEAAEKKKREEEAEAARIAAKKKALAETEARQKEQDRRLKEMEAKRKADAERRKAEAFQKKKEAAEKRKKEQEAKRKADATAQKAAKAKRDKEMAEARKEAEEQRKAEAEQAQKEDKPLEDKPGMPVTVCNRCYTPQYPSMFDDEFPCINCETKLTLSPGAKAERDAAAIKIQSIAKGRAQRRGLEKMRKEAEEAAAEAEAEAKAQHQLSVVCKNCSALLLFPEETAPANFNCEVCQHNQPLDRKEAEERRQAAIKIQALQKGRKDRRKIAAMKAERLKEAEEEEKRALQQYLEDMNGDTLSTGLGQLQAGMPLTVCPNCRQLNPTPMTGNEFQCAHGNCKKQIVMNKNQLEMRDKAAKRINDAKAARAKRMNQ